MTDTPRRNRFCCCSPADSNLGKARAVCTLHGNTDEANAYRAGMRDASNGFAVSEARPLREEDR